MTTLKDVALMMVIDGKYHLSYVKVTDGSDALFRADFFPAILHSEKYFSTVIGNAFANKEPQFVKEFLEKNSNIQAKVEVVKGDGNIMEFKVPYPFPGHAPDRKLVISKNEIVEKKIEEVQEDEFQLGTLF